MHKPRTILAGLDMITQLGLEVEDDPILGQSVKVDQLFSTTVRGVFVWGGCGEPMSVLGCMVAAGIVQQLVADDMELLLAEKKTV
ncbi:hypothetical protein GB937_007844 [Aspergillus fischeri]|nr:hypothetical protein GB937_007844 [Aspergillus fischeri]